MDAKLRKRLNATIRALKGYGYPDKTKAVEECMDALERRNSQLAGCMHINTLLSTRLKEASLAADRQIAEDTKAVLSDSSTKEARGAVKPGKIDSEPSSARLPASWGEVEDTETDYRSLGVQIREADAKEKEADNGE